MELSSAAIGLAGVVFGTLLGHYFNQQLNRRNARKDVLFRKKLEYFEHLAETIEKNITTYKNALFSIKEEPSSKEISRILIEMKESRKNFRITASPLYFNLKNNLPEKIINFVNIEKEIFNRFEELKKRNRIQEKNLNRLEEKIGELKKCANSMLTEMKLELKNE